MRKRIVWTQEMDDLLGTESDNALARKFGVPPDRVRYRRRKLGIKSYRIRGGHPGEHWTPEAYDLLGTMTDVEIAKKLGISPEAVRNRRKKFGIPKFKENRVASLLHRLTQAEAENQRLKKRVRELEKFCAGITNDWEWDDEPSGKAG